MTQDSFDTSAHVSQLVADCYSAMTSAERCLAAASMYETARAIVESSLAKDLSREER